MTLEIVQLLCGRDNYAALLHDTASGMTGVVDTPDGGPIAAELKRRGWGLDVIWTTHHHGDHTAGHLLLKSAYNCKIIAPKREFAKVPGADTAVSGGDVFNFAGRQVSVIDTPGHTSGHITFHIPDENIMFAGDTLFALGCGRLLEDTPQAMWTSLQKLRALSPHTQVYCGHEYTESNARFALTIEPDNPALQARAAKVFAQRASSLPTVPSSLSEEIATNPFLRADHPAIAAHLGMTGEAPDRVFAEIRARKDRF
ncbi:hydroxyacylglutathione hydrolase [Candidatus Raskinella chloraquaticus]|uniref:Hydroxyacylglutathione hydrolase n=1 Tax=Candidatus Raskinella chloraquaticus TaxID=1951219 RepID=A0A1W9HYV9_9HYPH|nr:MAG: hydroxyacylglutathione hydrolase [Proteobacteria bacterium SG_bin8]